MHCQEIQFGKKGEIYFITDNEPALIAACLKSFSK